MQKEAGTYTFVVTWRGTSKVTVEADTEMEAFRKAEEVAEEPWDYDILDMDIDEFIPYKEPAEVDMNDVWIQAIKDYKRRKANGDISNL